MREFTRLSIGQSLPFDALEGFCGALAVLNAKAGTIVVSEIELREIAMQMGFADRMIRSDDPALEDAEKVFDRVRVNKTAKARILVGGVIDRMMVLKFVADLGIDFAVVGH